MKQVYASFILFFSICQCGFGQLSGVITSTSGDTLPYVTIFSKEQAQGTLSNEEGNFELALDNGKHTIVIKHLGYEDYVVTIDFQEQQELNVQLKERSFVLEEFTITANGEDPAYPVIRAAIKRRKQYFEARKKYSVDVYTKGVGKVLNAPKSIMGNDVGDMDGMLDSTRQGIVYLAESESTYYFHQPNFKKEIVNSSVVAEGDDAFNVNRFLNVEYDIYTPSFEFNKTIINPLANNATSWYTYELLNLITREDGSQVYRIKVIPKNDSRALMRGELYIEDESFKVTELELQIAGITIGQPFFNAIIFKQVYHTDNEAYTLPISQVTTLDVGMFGFDIKADFTFVYNNYNFGNERLNPSFFDAEVYRFDEAAVVSDGTYWNKNRPVPLTAEERINYMKKDSLKKLWGSKEYLDSVDQKNNKFGVLNILSGYTYENSYKHRSFSVASPINKVIFHPVTGFSTGLHTRYNKYFGHKHRKRFNITANIDYGFADKKARWKLSSFLQTNNGKAEFLTLGIGDQYNQFGYNGMTAYALGTIEALLNRNYVIQLYRNRFARLGYRRELLNGLHLTLKSEYVERSRLKNHTHYDLTLNTNPYSANFPLPKDELTNDFFPTHTMWTTEMALKFKPFQKYMTYKSVKINQSNNWPTIDVSYKIGLGSDDRAFQNLRLGLTMHEIKMNMLGKSYLRVEAGTFLSSKNLEFIDQFHFRTANTLLTSSNYYYKAFKQMPFYTYSTSSNYVMNIYEHTFDGLIFGSIPLLNKLGWSTVVGVNSVIRQDDTNYFETSVGITDIRIFGVNLFRLDYTWSFDDGKYSNSGLSIGFAIDL